MNKRLIEKLSEEVGYKPLTIPSPKHPHPLKSTFQELGIPQALVAAHVGYNHAYVRQVLTGQRYASERLNTALHIFAEKARAEVERLAAETMR